MAHTKSGKKRIRTAEKSRVSNQAIKSRSKTMVKKILTAIENKDIDSAKTALSVAYKELDKAVTKGVFKKNTVSRTKSRLSARVNAL